jgi:hypothetical protein
MHIYRGNVMNGVSIRCNTYANPDTIYNLSNNGTVLNTPEISDPMEAINIACGIVGVGPVNVKVVTLNPPHTETIVAQAQYMLVQIQ